MACAATTAAQPRVDRVWVRWVVDESPDLSYVDRTEEDHCGPRGRNWRHMSAEDKAKVRAQYGSIRAACRAYAQQDRERLESHGDTWCMTGCVAYAEVSVPSGHGGRRLQRFDSGGLWGIESDSGDDYKAEVEREQLADLKGHLEAFGVDVSRFEGLPVERRGD